MLLSCNQWLWSDDTANAQVAHCILHILVGSSSVDADSLHILVCIPIIVYRTSILLTSAHDANLRLSAPDVAGSKAAATCVFKH